MDARLGRLSLTLKVNLETHNNTNKGRLTAAKESIMVESELKAAIAEYEDSGCTNMSKSLGIKEMPSGYALMLNSDNTHYFWITDSLESSISWNKWAVYRSAMADSNRLKVG